MGVGDDPPTSTASDGRGRRDSISLLPSLLSEFGSEGAAHVASDLLARANLVLEGGTRTPGGDRRAGWSPRPAAPIPTDRVARAVDFIVQLQRLAGPPEEAFGADRRAAGRARAGPGAAPRDRAGAGAPAELRRQPSRGRRRPEPRTGAPLLHRPGLRASRRRRRRESAARSAAAVGTTTWSGRWAGATAIPACGFSFGLERLKLALDAEGAALARRPAVDVVVAPIEEADEPLAVAIATQLRQAGLDVELDVRRRGVKANLRHADREGIPYVVIVGERERQAGQPLLRDMRVPERAGARRRRARRGGEGRTMTAHVAPLPVAAEPASRTPQRHRRRRRSGSRCPRRAWRSRRSISWHSAA